jgi:hypothetical protein
MECPKCNHFNDAGTDFCTQCGETMGKRKCKNGHVIAAGLTECPFCPKPQKTVMASPPPLPAKGGRKGTMVVSAGQLPSGEAAAPPHLTAASNPPAPSGSPKGRGKTMVVSPEVARSKADKADPSKSLADWVPNTGDAPLVGFLISFSTDPNGLFWPLRFGRTSIGSTSDNDICLNFPDVSGVHAMINIRSNKKTPKIWISDNNSMNGTAINGEDIFNERPDVNAGDVIQIGGIEMRLVLV